MDEGKKTTLTGLVLIDKGGGCSGEKSCVRGARRLSDAQDWR